MGTVNHMPEKKMNDSVWSVKNTQPEVYKPMDGSEEEYLCHVTSSLMQEGRFDEAERYFKLGMSEGYMKVANKYATALSMGWIGRVDEKLALLIFQTLAYRRYPIAMYNYGMAIRLGCGRKADTGTGNMWIDRAADAGIDVAMTSKGIRLAYENDGNPNFKSAFELFTKAADYGESTAMYQLGLMYLNGNYVAIDYGKAVEWFRKAITLGEGCFPEYYLARCYHSGKGVSKNEEKAREFVAIAIRHGLPEEFIPPWYITGR